MRTRAFLAAIFLITACQKDPSAEFAKTVRADHRELRKSADTITKAIQGQFADGALVVFGAFTDSPQIIPTDNPARAIAEHKVPTIWGMSRCYYVYHPLERRPAAELPCELLRAEGEEILELDKALETSLRLGAINADMVRAQESELQELRAYAQASEKDLAALNRRLERLLQISEASSKRVEEALKRLPR